ncbi:unnamed protein product [Amaranthus hypochondriacus]
MENTMNDMNFKGLVNELVEGRDLTKELIQLNLCNDSHFASNEAYGKMANKILAKFEKSLQILEYDSISQFQFHRVIAEKTDSPNSFSGSPKSLDSDGGFRDESKKRRISPRVIHRVEGSPSSGLESPKEDGYNWRKYGQKDILGANFPRAYYRCTFRVLQGCLATKQVQRSDDDPCYFEVSYRGTHTCSQASSSSPSVGPKLEPIQSFSDPPHDHSKNIIWNFKTENNNTQDIKPIVTNNPNHLKPSTFSFPSINPLIKTQQTPTTLLNYNDNNFVNHATFPTNHTNCENIGVIDHHLQEVVHPSSTSATNSPPFASDLTFDHQGEIDDEFAHFFQ